MLNRPLTRRAMPPKMAVVSKRLQPQRRLRRKRLVAALALAIASLHAGAGEAVLSTVDPRWRDSLDAFAAADKAQPPVPGGVLFVGSSSIRLWDGLEQQFEVKPALLKRGFGGSRLADCAAYLDRLVLAYKPRQVVVYAGDNDLAEGRTPQQVLQSYAAFVEGVHKSLPNTRIAYLSIKPSPSRAALLPAMREANALIAQYSARDERLDFIDVFSRMVDEAGKPRAELFGADALHLNERGYALWRSVIATHLR